MFMVKVILFLILALIFSLALNVALAAVLYKNWVVISLYKPVKFLTIIMILSMVIAQY